MKAKLIILAAIAAVLLHSCSGERDNESVTPALEKTSATKSKLNSKRETSKSDLINSESNKADSITIKGLNAPEDPDGEIVDPTKPDRPW